MGLSELLDQYSDVQSLSEVECVRRGLGLERIAAGKFEEARQILLGRNHPEVWLRLWMRQPSARDPEFDAEWDRLDALELR